MKSSDLEDVRMKLASLALKCLETAERLDKLAGQNSRGDTNRRTTRPARTSRQSRTKR